MGEGELRADSEARRRLSSGSSSSCLTAAASRLRASASRDRSFAFARWTSANPMMTATSARAAAPAAKSLWSRERRWCRSVSCLSISRSVRRCALHARTGWARTSWKSSYRVSPSPVGGGGMRRRTRPLSARQSLSSTASTSGSGRCVHSARSEAGCAIFVLERVTRKRKTSAATACSGPVSEPSDSSRWFSTMRSAPPSSSSRETRQIEGSGCDGRAPQPFHHQLQEGRLHPLGVRAGRGCLGEALPEHEPAARGGIDHRLDEAGLDRVRGRVATVPLARSALRSRGVRPRG